MWHLTSLIPRFTRRLLDSVTSNTHDHALERLPEEELAAVRRTRGKRAKESAPRAVYDVEVEVESSPRSYSSASESPSGLRSASSKARYSMFSTTAVEPDDYTSTLLPLYQVSLLIEKLNCSYYFDERHLIGLSDSQGMDDVCTRFFGLLFD